MTCKPPVAFGSSLAIANNMDSLTTGQGRVEVEVVRNNGALEGSGSKATVPLNREGGGGRKKFFLRGPPGGAVARSARRAGVTSGADG